MQTLFEDEPVASAPRRLQQDPFWPRVHAVEVRRALGLGDEVSDTRLEVALRSAVMTLEREFAGARYLWRCEGFKTLDEVPATMEGVLSIVERQYRDALHRATRRLLDEQLQVREGTHV